VQIGAVAANPAVDTVTYKINALGQRVLKTAAGAQATNAAALGKTARFMYDEQGRLVGEYDSAGKLIQETVWMNDLPIATIRPKGATVSAPLGITGTGAATANNLGTNTAANPVNVDFFYVHPDHLGTPRVVTKPADNKKVWEWQSQPFGEGAANENPQNLTGAALTANQFRYNLRFPGQVYDAETNKHYNYFRDYDPSLGRYVESDPIGLRAGMNTYAYVKNRPLKKVDPKGLVGFDPPYPPPRPPERPDGNDWGWGCGDQATDNLVPDAPFLKCCREYDKCYEKCGSSRARFDKDFCSCNFSVCAAALISLPCQALAAVYCAGVAAGGEPGFKEGQKNCGCLPPYNGPSQPSPIPRTF
jgi:RHS repeat-associated protein